SHILILNQLFNNSSPFFLAICGEEPAVVGGCRGAFPSYTYYATNNTCGRFIYGGCMGTENVFPNRKKCEETCVE
ncbi:hypothetical protein KR038_001773, partial [Drosophila bunnanda]